MKTPLDSPGDESWDERDWNWHPHRMQANPVSNRGAKSKSKPRACKTSLVCQVEGCNNDLSELKEYHRRYKICRCHLKDEFIIKDGIQQRFCQQCGRFHDIREFDGKKRSCRQRLKRHNERRRKKPNSGCNRPESAGSGLTNSSMTLDSKLDSGEQASLFEEDFPDPSPVASSLFSSSSQHPYFPVLPSALHRSNIIPPLRVESTSSTRFNDVKSDSPKETKISDPLLEVYRNFSQNCSAAEFLHSIDSKDALMPTIPEVNPLNQGTGGPLTMPLTPKVAFGRPLMDPVAFLTPERTHSSPASFKRDVCESLPWAKGCLSHRSSSIGSDSESMSIASVPPLVPSLAMEPMHENERFALYNNVVKLTSLSVKLYSCTPRSLPPDLRMKLVHAVRGGWCPEGYMRKGCVLLTFDIFQPAMRDTLCLEDVVNRLLHSKNPVFWKDTNMLVQLNNQAIFVSRGIVKRSLNQRQNPDLYHEIQSITPLCVQNKGSKQFIISGASSKSDDDDISIHCRIQGKHIAVAAVENNGEMGTCNIAIADDLPVGAVKVEISKNGLICRTMTVLSIDDRDVVEEIDTFSASTVDLDGFLSELGLLFELRTWLLRISVRCQVTIDRIRESLQQSVRSQCITRLSFKSCSKHELSGLLFSAQRLYCYCDQQGLRCTQHYIWPVCWLAHGGVSIEKALTSVLDDVCTLIILRNKLRVSISVVDSMTGVNLNRDLLVSSK